METITIFLLVCGWLAATFIAGCIMEAVAVKLERIKIKHQRSRTARINKSNMRQRA